MSSPLQWTVAIILGVLFVRNYQEIEHKLVMWLVMPVSVDCKFDLLGRKGK